jgi:hypothetical protein
VLVPTRPPTSDVWRAKIATVFRLSDIAGITETGLNLDRAYIEDAVPRNAHSVPVKSVASFPVPDGATWEDLRIMIRDAGILAGVGGSSLEFSTEELGFTSAQDRVWQLLCLFARLGGQTPARSTGVSDKDTITLRKQVSNLRQRLATIFPIAGEPIRSVHGTGAYRCVFQIGLGRRDGFPAPPGRWDDCRFTELRDGRISILVKSKEVFAARTIPEETLRRTAIEAAERVGVRTEDYDLRVLGWADQSSIATSEGRLLLEFLRNDGKLNRRGDDKDHLVDHHAIDKPLADVLEQLIQRRPVHVRAGKPAVVIMIRQRHPSLAALASDERLGRIALGVKRVEFLLQSFLSGLAGVDGAPNGRAPET